LGENKKLDELDELEKARRIAEDAEYASMAMEFDELHTPPETKRESAPEISHFNELVAAFEVEHSLEALHAITELTAKDAPDHPVRGPAKLALKEIFAQLKVLEKETDISPEELTAVKLEKKRISQAVGMINRGIVDHTR